MMFADYVVLRAKDIHVGEGTGAVKGNLGEENNESVKRKDRVHVSEKAVRIVKMQSTQRPHVTTFKRSGSTLQIDGDMNAEVNKRTQSGWKSWNICKEYDGGSTLIERSK